MSPWLANTVALAFFAVLSAPLVLTIRGGRRAMTVAAGTSVFILGIAGYSLWASAGLATTQTADLRLPTADAARCNEALTLLDQAGVIIDRRNPLRPVIVGSAWDQLPDTVQTAVLGCFEEAGGGTVEIVRR
jgi:hypothetical protein